MSPGSVSTTCPGSVGSQARGADPADGLAELRVMRTGDIRRSAAVGSDRFEVSEKPHTPERQIGICVPGCLAVVPGALALVGSTGPPNTAAATVSARSSNDKLTGVWAVIIGTYWNRMSPRSGTSLRIPFAMTLSISAASGPGSKN